MNYGIRFTTTIFVLALFGICSAQSRVARNRKPRTLTFEFLLCGVGPFGSHQTYKVSDGTIVSVDSQTYETLDEAMKSVADELKVARRIVDRKIVLGGTDEKVGERIVFVTVNRGNNMTVWLSLKERFVYKIEAASVRHINAFRKWERATEQALGPDSP